MKTYAHSLSVVICIVLAAPIANADTIVFSGATYDVVITDPIPVGANPGGESLVGFTLSIVNTSGNPTKNPASFDGNTPKETRPLDFDNSNWLGMPTYTGFTSGATTADYVAGSPGSYPVVVAGDPGFHNQFRFGSLGATPTLDEPDFASAVDTHFLLTTPQVLTPNNGPSEDFTMGFFPNILLTNEPSNVPSTNPWKVFEANSFGNRLFGQFTTNGGAAANIDGDGDPTTWQLAYFAMPIDGVVHMNFKIGSLGESEIVEGSFAVGSEPTMTSLQVASGDWSEAAHWTAVVPDAGLDAYVNNGGTVNISSSGAAKNLYVGSSAAGSVQHVAGNINTDTVSLGRDANAVGTYELTGSGQLTANDLVVGDSGTGTFTQSGGSAVVVQTIMLAKESGSHGTYNFQGGELTVGTLTRGSGAGEFNWTGGVLHAGTVAFDLTNDGGILSPGSSIGTTSILGDYLQTFAGTMEFDIDGLAQGTGHDYISISGAADLAGLLSVKLLAGSSFVPQLGDTFDVLTAGSIVDDLSLAGDSMAGGLLWSHDLIAGQTLRLEVVQGVSLAGAGEDDHVYVGDGLMDPVTQQTVQTVNIGDGCVLAMAPDANLTVIDQLYIEEGGVLSVSGTITGDVINAGTLNVNGGTYTDTVKNRGSVNLGGGGGTFGGGLDNSGIVRITDPLGTAEIDGDYTQLETGTLEMDIAGYLQAVEYDFLYITGQARLEGFIDVSLLGGFVPNMGDTFDILTADLGITIGYRGLDIVGDGYFIYDLVNGDTTLQLEYIPEPATLGLLALGGLAVLRRRKK